MLPHNPRQAACRWLERKILTGIGVRSFAELHHTVIYKGFPASDVEQEPFMSLQTAFHAVQGLRWARQERAEARAVWVLDARRRAERLDIRLS